MDAKKRRIIETCLIFIAFTAFFVAIHLTAGLLSYDYIWCFHMSQKVANGYMMYSEISTVIGPIYPMIGGIFIKIFGNGLTSLAIYGRACYGCICRDNV